MGKDLKGKELGNGISQRKDKKYQGRYVDRFGQRRTVYDRELSKLREKLNAAVYEDKNHLNIVETGMTLDDWFEKWMAIYKYNVIKPTTRQTYLTQYRKHISPVIGKLAISDITQLQIRGLIKKMSDKGLGYEMQNKTRVMLLDMFNKALIDDFVRKNPAKGIKLVRNEEAEFRVLTPQEQSDFFDCCRGTFYDNAFTVQVATGLRPGELFALEESDIDFDKMEISVTKTLLYQTLESLGDTKKTFHIVPPKTKTSRRRVPINRVCEIALKKQILQKKVVVSKSSVQTDNQFKDLIFTTKYNTPINSQIYSDAIKRIVNEVNLMKDPLEELEVFSGHAFRHTFATRCLEAGIDITVVQKYLGHATTQMTMRYAHVLDKFKMTEMEKFDSMYDQITALADENVYSRYDKLLEQEAKKKNLIQFASGD